MKITKIKKIRKIIKINKIYIKRLINKFIKMIY